jgi:DNA-directed RNA polymerase subunit RPC12/RpoP
MPKVVALLQAGKLRATDEIAKTPKGPWTQLGKAVRGDLQQIPIVESFGIKKTLFGGGLIATYECLRCHTSLESAEEDWRNAERCPSCGYRYRLSPRVLQVVAERRKAELREKVAAAEAAQVARERKEAERKAAADRNEELRRREAKAEKAEEFRQRTEKAQLVGQAANARNAAGACWYCGARQVSAIRQCPACRMVAFARPS